MNFRDPHGIRGEFESIARERKYLNINDLMWLCWPSAANPSPFVRFPDHWENTGKLYRFRGEGRETAWFPNISQLVTPKFPTHLNREFCGANRECFPHSWESCWLNLPRRNFRKGQAQG